MQSGKPHIYPCLVFSSSVLEVLFSNFSEVTWFEHNNNSLPEELEFDFLGLLAFRFLGSGHILVFLSNMMVWNLNKSGLGLRLGLGQELELDSELDRYMYENGRIMPAGSLGQR